MKSFGECCGSTVLTVACYWPSSNCIPTQKIVSVSAKLNHNRSPLVLDSENGAYSGAWRSGQEASFVPPCSNLRPVGRKCTALKKVFVALLGLFCGLRSHSAPLAVIRRLENCAPFAPSSCSCVCCHHTSS